MFVLAFDGIISFIPGVQGLHLRPAHPDLTNSISGTGDTQNGLAVAILGVLAWCVVIVAPGWLRFLRGDLK